MSFSTIMVHVDAEHDTEQRVELAIGLADNDFSSDEREVATQLATAIGVPVTELDERVAEIRG